MLYKVILSPSSDVVVYCHYDERTGNIVGDHGFEPIPLRFGQSVSGAILERYPQAKVWL